MALMCAAADSTLTPLCQADLVVDLSKQTVRSAAHMIILLLESAGLL